jgi:hypothetical protein
VKRTIRDRIAELERQGLVVDRIRRGKHVKLGVTAPDGRALMIVVGVTPNDHRAPRNFAALLRRFARTESTLTTSLPSNRGTCP